MYDEDIVIRMHLHRCDGSLKSMENLLPARQTLRDSTLENVRNQETSGFC